MHSSHFAAPGVLENVPGGHTVHDVAPSPETKPAMHGSQVSLFETGAKDPGAQGIGLADMA